MEPEQVEPPQKRARHGNEGGGIPPPPPFPRPRRTCRELRRARLPRIPPTVEDMVLHQHYGAITVETEESPTTSFARQPQRSVEEHQQRFDEIASSFDELVSPAVVLEAHELTEESKLVYIYNFIMHCGMSFSTLDLFNDVLRICTGGEHYGNICNSMKSEVGKMIEKYRYRAHYYCRSCDSFLPSRFSLCSTRFCPLQNVKCKRSKEMNRTSVHTVAIRPQLEAVLRRAVDDLVAIHRSHHAGQRVRSKSETFHFAAYTDDIESPDAFMRGEIHVILTMNFDGVTFKKLSRRALVIRKTPTEALLSHLLTSLQLELRQLEETPLVVKDKTGKSWKCVAKLKHSIMDLAAVRVLYKFPKWGSLYGCHLCRVRGERDGRRVLWHAPFASHTDRRTHEHILQDAERREYGLSGLTKMMEILTMERCRPDSLHLMDEGLTCDLFKKLFFGRGRLKDFRVSKQSMSLLSAAMQKISNYTYSPAAILGLKDLSSCTGSEKRALAGVLFALAGAQNMCSNPVASVALLSYWVLMRQLEFAHMRESKLGAIREAASNLKMLWGQLTPRLFTLKLHVLLDHAIVEDVFYAGPPNFWTSAGFESIHKRLQMKVAPNTTNSECFFFERFLLRKNLLWRLRDECLKTGRLEFYYLLKRMQDGDTRWSGIRSELHLDWFVPHYSHLQLHELRDAHRDAVEHYRDRFSLNSRLGRDGNKYYVSRYYWPRPSETAQNCVVIMEADVITFGNVILFLYDPITKDCLIFMEEFLVKDPFEGLVSSLGVCNQPVKGAATDALRGIRRHNRFFKEVSSSRFSVRNAYSIVGAAVLAKINGIRYVSRVL